MVYFLIAGPMTPSQMHASAATGQPLLATGPLQTQFIPYPQTPHGTHFQSQPYPAPMVSFLTIWMINKINRDCVNLF